MVIGADNDQVWDSGPMARRIAAARQTAGLATDLLVYPTAGHALSGPGWSPTTGYNAGPMQMGGDPPANGRAVADGLVPGHYVVCGPGASPRAVAPRTARVEVGVGVVEGVLVEAAGVRPVRVEGRAG